MVTFNYVIHVIIGLISSAPFQQIPNDALLGMFAALIPDIDIKSSLLGRFNPLAHLGLTKHRGKTHTIGIALIISIPFLAVGNLTFLVGWLSHIFADYVYSWGKWKIKWI